MYLNTDKIEDLYKSIETRRLNRYPRSNEMSDYYFDRLPEEIKIDLLFKSKEYNFPIVIVKKRNKKKEEYPETVILFDYFRESHSELYEKYKLILDWL